MDLGLSVAHLLTVIGLGLGFVVWAKTRVALLERCADEATRATETLRVALSAHESGFGHEPARSRVHELADDLHQVGLRLAMVEARNEEHERKIADVAKLLSDLRDEVADVRERLVRIEALLERVLNGNPR